MTEDKTTPLPQAGADGKVAALAVVVGVGVIAIAIVFAPEIAAAAAVLSGTITSIAGFTFRVTSWLAIRAPGLVAVVMGLLRGAVGMSSSGGSAVADSPEGMRMDYEIWRGAELIEEGTIFSGPGGVWGHAEARFAEMFMGELGPEHDVILLGSYNMCSYGQCRYILNSWAIMDGPNIFYWGHSFDNQPMLQQFLSGIGIVYAP